MLAAEIRPPGTADDPTPERVTAEELAWRGIERCRRGEWEEGLYELGRAAAADAGTGALPGLHYAYFGYGVARYRRRLEQGRALCRRAVEAEPYQGEGYYFLACVELLADDRRAAVDAAERGLEVDAANAELLALKAELGERRPPVVRALPRRHPLNRGLGKIRHRLLGPRRPGV